MLRNLRSSWLLLVIGAIFLRNIGEIFAEKNFLAFSNFHSIV